MDFGLGRDADHVAIIAHIIRVEGERARLLIQNEDPNIKWRAKLFKRREGVNQAAFWDRTLENGEQGNSALRRAVREIEDLTSDDDLRA